MSESSVNTSVSQLKRTSGHNIDVKAKDGKRNEDVSSPHSDMPDKIDADSAKSTFSGKITFGSLTTLSSTVTNETDDDDHLNVVLRVRPLSSQEIARRDVIMCTFPGQGAVAVESNGSKRQFGFNVVFEPEASQEDVFYHSGIKRLIDMAVNGYSCTAFAFGQTGSGKTHTMTGPPQQFQNNGRPGLEEEGLIQRSFRYLLQELKQHSENILIRASYLEIYNEQVIDLLNTNQRKYLAVRWSKNRGFYVENLFVVECENLDDLLAVLEEGLRNRQSGSLSQNEFSSRSHSMLTLNLDSDMNYPDDDNLYVTKRGKLSFVDLAGSEKVKDQQTGETLLESNSINKSLLVLGNCISSLGNAKRREGHIPYRDSKLTKLLADSLGGNGVTLMIACVTPSSNHTMETMNTLRYANRAKKIKSKPVVKMDPREKLILTLKREIKVLRNENHYLRQQLEFPAKPKGQLQKENDERLVQFMKEQKQKTGKPNGTQTDSGLYEMLQEYMVENESLRGENSDLQSSKDRLRREQQLLYRENDKLMKRLEVLEKTVLGNQGPLPYRMSPVSITQSGGLSSFENSPLHSPSPQHKKNGKGYSRGSSFAPNNAAFVQTDGPDAGYVSSPSGRRPQGQMKPPHRLSEPVLRPTQGNPEAGRGAPHVSQMGLVQPADGYTMPSPQGHSVAPHQVLNQGYSTHHGHDPGSPRLVRKVSPSKQRNVNAPDNSKEDLQHMNEKLKRELADLEGEIKQHQQLQRSKNSYHAGPGKR
ncbi:kinesin-like protein KIF12 [Liolophura sinensis]|uniref:kinesin-like protein KIF12 n=1 Tax=Liolophura sinensis TaxID=3198878 RepID=UPI0031596F40